MKKAQLVTCVHKYSEVIDSRPMFDRDLGKRLTRRRRKCADCGQRFTTVEIPIDPGSKGKKLVDRLVGQVIKDEVNETIDFLIEVLEGVKKE